MEAHAVRLGQVLVAEVVLLAVLAAVGGPLWLLTAAAAGAGAVLLATFGRTGGRWWYQAVGYRRRYVRRRKAAAAGVVGGTVSYGIGSTASAPVISWLRTLAPGLRVAPVTVRGTVVGVAVDEGAGGGWFAVVDLSAGGSGLSASPSGPGAEAALAALATLMAPGDRPPVGSTLQLVVHTVHGMPTGPAAAAYRELSGGARTAARRATYVAVRLAAADAVVIEDRGGTPAVETAVGTAALRVAKALRVIGYPAEPLDPTGLTTALLDLSTLDNPPQEHWNVWSSGVLARTSHAITRWPVGLSVSDLVGATGGVSSLAITVDGADRRQAVLTVAAEPGDLATVNRMTVQNLASLGVKLRRLDGEQALAAYASLPTGVALSDVTKRAAVLGPPAVPGRTESTVEGLLLGRDAQQEAVALRFFRPVPTKIAVVGGWWLPRVIAFRALALGVRVVVRSAVPSRWAGLGEAAGAPARYTVSPPDRVVSTPAAGYAPALLIDDPAPGMDPPTVGPWQTRLVVLPVLGPADLGELAAADAVLLPKLTPAEAAGATAALRLADETTRLLQLMHDDMVAVIGGAADRYVWTTPTPIEQSVLGGARRGE